jgi:signal transduction histidine kinase
MGQLHADSRTRSTEADYTHAQPLKRSAPHRTKRQLLSGEPDGPRGPFDDGHVDKRARNPALDRRGAVRLAVDADQQIPASVVANHVQNSFKFTRPYGHIMVRARASADRVLIEVEDECGGLPLGKAQDLFKPFGNVAPIGQDSASASRSDGRIFRPAVVKSRFGICPATGACSR